MKAEDIINAAKALDNIEKPKGFSEIKIIQSPFVKDGNPILLVSENDYKQFAEIKDINGESKIDQSQFDIYKRLFRKL